MKKLLYILLLLATSVACDDKLQTEGTFLKIYLGDSPAEYSRVMIAIESLEIYNGTEWVELQFYPQTINILQYSGGATLKIIDQPIATGLYSLLRITFNTQDNAFWIGDQETALTISEQDRVVELDLRLRIDDGIYSVFCDMDVAKSVNETQMSLEPNITVVDIENYGAISGSIAQTIGTTAVEVFYIEAQSSTGVIRSTYSNPTDAKFFVRLPAETYTVRILPKAGSVFEPKTIENVVVTAAQATLLGKITLVSTATPAL